MSQSVTKLDNSGRFLIPAHMRREMGVEAGDELILRVDEEGLHISTPGQALARAQAFVASLGSEGRDLAAELVAERRREAQKESAQVSAEEAE